MKAVQLINRAYVFSGVSARDLQQVEGGQGTDGLFLLNMLLAEKSATGRLLPYYGHVEKTAVINEEVIFFEGLVTLDILTFNVSTVRYSVRPTPRNKYFGNPRADGVSSIPFEWYWERVPGGINVYIYFTPDAEYPINATGLIGFTNVDFDTQLDLMMDTFYQNFLMFELAESICLWKKLSLPPETAVRLSRLRKEMIDINPKDYSISKISLFGGSPNMSFAQINIGRGWT